MYVYLEQFWPTLFLYQLACPQWYFNVDSLIKKSYDTKTELELFISASIWTKSKGRDDTLHMNRMIRICIFCACLKAFLASCSPYIVWTNVGMYIFLQWGSYGSSLGQIQIVKVKNRLCKTGVWSQLTESINEYINKTAESLIGLCQDTF